MELSQWNERDKARSAESGCVAWGSLRSRGRPAVIQGVISKAVGAVHTPAPSGGVVGNGGNRNNRSRRSLPGGLAQKVLASKTPLVMLAHVHGLIEGFHQVGE